MHFSQEVVLAFIAAAAIHASAQQFDVRSVDGAGAHDDVLSFYAREAEPKHKKNQQRDLSEDDAWAIYARDTAWGGDFESLYNREAGPGGRGGGGRGGMPGGGGRGGDMGMRGGGGMRGRGGGGGRRGKGGAPPPAEPAPAQERRSIQDLDDIFNFYAREAGRGGFGGRGRGGKGRRGGGGETPVESRSINSDDASELYSREAFPGHGGRGRGGRGKRGGRGEASVESRSIVEDSSDSFGLYSREARGGGRKKKQSAAERRSLIDEDDEMLHFEERDVQDEADALFNELFTREAEPESWAFSEDDLQVRDVEFEELAVRDDDE